MVGVALGYFVGVPRIRDAAQVGVRDAIGTEVARQIPATTGQAAPGSYTIFEDELQTSLNANVTANGVDTLDIQINPSGFSFRLSAQGNRESTYTGVPVAEDGRLVMTRMETSNGFLDFVFPAEDLGVAIEDAVNGYLAANGLALDGLALGDGELTLETVAAR